MRAGDAENRRFRRAPISSVSPETAPARRGRPRLIVCPKYHVPPKSIWEIKRCTRVRCCRLEVKITSIFHTESPRGSHVGEAAGNGSIANSSGVADNGLFDISDLGNHGTTPVSTSITSLSGSAGGMVNLGENTLTITNASGTFAGVIADGGTSGGVGGALAINSGTEILTGANTYTGATAINGGTLEVDGSIASSSQTTVANNGTLQGIGTVGNLQVNSGGAFAPGAVGSSNTQMNVQGSLAFQSGAFYVTQVSPSSATFANVTGTASLAGTVIATFSTGSYLTKNYLILQSAGLSGTTFGTLDTLGLPRGATASLSYTADDVFLDLSVSLSATGLNTNQKNVANAINAFFNSGGALPPNFASLIGLSGSPLATALTQLDGEANADAEKGAFQLMSDFLNLMLDPSSGGGGGAGGGGTGGSGALGFAPERDATLPPEIALAYNSMLTKALPKPQSFDQRWTAWGSAFGGTSHTNGDPVVGSNNVDASDYGFAGGADYRVSRDTVLGFALAGGGTNWNWRRASATAGAMHSRPASTPRPMPVRLISPLRSPLPTTGSPPTAPRLLAISCKPNSRARVTADGSRPVTVTACRRRTASPGSRLMPRCRRRASTPRAIPRSISPVAALGSPSTP